MKLIRSFFLVIVLINLGFSSPDLNRSIGLPTLRQISLYGDVDNETLVYWEPNHARVKTVAKIPVAEFDNKRKSLRVRITMKPNQLEEIFEEVKTYHNRDSVFLPVAYDDLRIVLPRESSFYWKYRLLEQPFDVAQDFYVEFFLTKMGIELLKKEKNSLVFGTIKAKAKFSTRYKTGIEDTVLDRSFGISVGPFLFCHLQGDAC